MDWRITNQFDYLFKKRLQRKKFRKTILNDHEHCCFCWNKFGEEEFDLKEGYCTIDEYNWICEQCYNDFKDSFFGY